MRVRSLIQEDKAHTQLLSLCSRVWEPLAQLFKPARSRVCCPQQEKPWRWETHTPKVEQPLLSETREEPAWQWRPSTVKNKQTVFLLKRHMFRDWDQYCQHLSVERLFWNWFTRCVGFKYTAKRFGFKIVFHYMLLQATEYSSLAIQ